MEKAFSRQLSDPERTSDSNPCQPLGRTPNWGKDHGEDIVEVGPPNEMEECQTGRKTELFPVVSAAHECISLLIVMLGYADLLRCGRFGPLNETQRNMLGEIQQGGERLR